MHDSGERQEFDTGAVRDTAAGKPRIDLISPFFMQRLGGWLAEGAKKYSDRNWEKGIHNSRCLASLCRHLEAYKAGEKGEDHIIAVACNAMFIAHNEVMVDRGVLPPEIQDMPNYRPDIYPLTESQAYRDMNGGG